MLPAALALLPIRVANHKGRAEHPRLHRVLVGCGTVATHHPRKVLAASIAVLAIGLAGALQLHISFDSLAWFPERDPLRIATLTVDHELKGSMTLEVMLHTERDDALHAPELLARIEALAERVSGFRDGELFVGKATSIVDIVKEIHQALHEGRPQFYAIPGERAVVAQELLLFEQSAAEDLDRVTDGRFSVARTTLRVPRVDATLYLDLIDAIEHSSQELLADFGEVDTTGALSLLGRITEATAVSMVRSYAIALLVITPLMILVMGSVGRGLLSMLPNLAPIVLGLGLMHAWDIPLDMTTILLGSIVLGLAVDDTIHFMHRFNRSYAESGDPHAAVRQTLQTTGAALMFTSLVLAAGFFILMFGYMVNVSNFGLLLGVATLVAFLADVLMAPALMVLVSPPRKHPC
jgi:predicted RND superfamily exporter protein